MFCDLVGSALSTQLDPEDLGNVIADFRAACTNAVARFGGSIAKYMGDGALVYFGYPEAYEDAAIRAILAGLARQVGGLLCRPSSGSPTPWWWGYTETVSPCPPRLHRISTHRFSNRPLRFKRFQTDHHHSSVDVAHGLVLLFGIGTRPFHHGSRRRGGTIYRAALL
jgi:hypothetical protein